MTFFDEWNAAKDQRTRGQWMLLEALHYLENISETMRTRADRVMILCIRYFIK